MKCPKCKEIIKNGEKTCQKCGQKISVRIKTTKEGNNLLDNEMEKTNNSAVMDKKINLEMYLKSIIEKFLEIKSSEDKLNEIIEPVYDPPAEPVYVKPKIEEPKYNPPKYVEFSIWEGILRFITGSFLGLMAGFLLFAVITLLVDKVVNDEFAGSNSMFIFSAICYLIGFFGGGIYSVYYGYNDSQLNKKLYDEKYKEQCKKNENIRLKAEDNFKVEKLKYEETLLKYKNNYEVKLNKYREEIKKQEELNDRLTHKLKKQLSEENIIHSKYRDIMAVTSFYNYISTGRCSALEGPDGAYNLYEEQLKQDKSNAYVEELNKKIAILETELKNKEERDRANRMLDVLDRQMLTHSLDFMTERISDRIDSLRDLHFSQY